jgi:hypothetical protein
MEGAAVDQAGGARQQQQLVKLRALKLLEQRVLAGLA